MLKAAWTKIKAFFKDSETIFLARLQMLLGAIGAVITGLLSNSDISSAIQQLLTPAYIPYYVIAIGLLTEYARRRRATDL